MTSDDFLSFYEYFKTFLVLQRIQLKLRPFHKEVCDTLQKAFLGQLDKRFIIINISPRVGKTKLVEAFACWCYAYFPDCHFINSSYADDLATSTTRYVREVLQSDWHVKMFGKRLGDLKQADHFETMYGGKMKGSGLSGILTGFGCGLKRAYGGALIIDDIQKPGEAHSKASTEAVHRWLTGVVSSRMNSPHVPVIICAQRISEEDICGHVMSNYPGDFILLKYPAMVDGVSVIEDTISTKDLLALERIDPFTFYSQYQQSPIVLGGNILKTDWFRYFDEEMNYEYKFFTIDSAMKTKEHNDNTVLSCWGVIGKNLYLEDCLIGKWEAPQLEEITKEFYKKHRPRLMKVELKASGIGLFQKLSQLGFPIVGIERFKDKYSRCLSAAPFISIGSVFLKKNLHHLQYILGETAGFRADLCHKHDDFCDTLFDAIEHIYGPDASVLDAL